MFMQIPFQFGKVAYMPYRIGKAPHKGSKVHLSNLTLSELCFLQYLQFKMHMANSINHKGTLRSIAFYLKIYELYMINAHISVKF